MNDELFKIEPSLSPEAEWLDQARDVLESCALDEGHIFECLFLPTKEKWRAQMMTGHAAYWISYGNSEAEAINAICQLSEEFPTFDQWRLEKERGDR